MVNNIGSKNFLLAKAAATSPDHRVKLPLGYSSGLMNLSLLATHWIILNRKGGGFAQPYLVCVPVVRILLGYRKCKFPSTCPPCLWVRLAKTPTFLCPGQELVPPFPPCQQCQTVASCEFQHISFGGLSHLLISPYETESRQQFYI